MTGRDRHPTDEAPSSSGLDPETFGPARNRLRRPTGYDKVAATSAGCALMTECDLLR
jgi:hypothetical protein